MIRKLTLGTLTAALVSLGAAAPLYAKPPGQGQEGKPPAGQQQERAQSEEKEKMTREQRRAKKQAEKAQKKAEKAERKAAETRQREQEKLQEKAEKESARAEQERSQAEEHRRNEEAQEAGNNSEIPIAEISQTGLPNINRMTMNGTIAIRRMMRKRTSPYILDSSLDNSDRRPPGRRCFIANQ
jgi:Spy/CpxP family protein refolding chaperone